MDILCPCERSVYLSSYCTHALHTCLLYVVSFTSLALGESYVIPARTVPSGAAAAAGPPGRGGGDLDTRRYDR